MFHLVAAEWWKCLFLTCKSFSFPLKSNIGRSEGKCVEHLREKSCFLLPISLNYIQNHFYVGMCKTGLKRPRFNKQSLSLNNYPVKGNCMQFRHHLNINMYTDFRGPDCSPTFPLLISIPLFPLKCEFLWKKVVRISNGSENNEDSNLYSPVICHYHVICYGICFSCSWK